VLSRHWRKGWSIRRAADGQHRPELFTPGKSGWPKRARLARLVTDAPSHLFPQHRNGDVLDCRRANLRLVVSRGRPAKGSPPFFTGKISPNEVLASQCSGSHC